MLLADFLVQLIKGKMQGEREKMRALQVQPFFYTS